MNYPIKYEQNPSSEDIQQLNNGIMENALQKRGMKPIEFFGFFVRNENHQIVAGCAGDLLYGCLYVGQLWVSASLRKKGYGTKLMELAENLAKERACNFMAVNTMDWEALDFYRSRGFFVEFERHGFDKNSIFYFLRKNL